MDESTNKKLKELYKRATVCIKIGSTNQIIGTGFFISNNLILTCHHVIINIDNKNIKIYFLDEVRNVTKSYINQQYHKNDYRSDFAVLEIEEPFSHNNHIFTWSNTPISGNILFGGYRTGSNLSIEAFSSEIGDFNDDRGCYMLKDGSPVGFSGSPVILKKDTPAIVGMTIAHLNQSVDRTWFLPTGELQRQLLNLGIQLTLSSKNSEISITNYLEYIENLKKKNHINEFYIDTSCIFIENNPNNYSLSSISYLKTFIKTESKFQEKICILGNYGTGKTCLAIETAYQLIKEYEEGTCNILPIYIPLKEWRTLPSTNEIVQKLLNYPYPFENLSTLQKFVFNKNIFFLLDGIDEIANTLNPVSSPGIVRELPRILPEDINFAVLGRISYFVNKTNIADVFSLMTDDIPPLLRLELQKSHYKVIQLKPLSKEQIKQCIYYRCRENHEFVLKFIEENYDLPNLATRPILLNIIIDCIDSIIEIHQNKQISITPAELYGVYINKWLRNPKQKSRLSTENRFIILESVSIYLLETHKLRLSYQELFDIVKKNIESINKGLIHEIENFIYDIVNCTFFDLTINEYEFSHKSFFEFFVACFILREIKNNNSNSERPFEKYLPSDYSLNEIVDYLRDLLYIECHNKEILDILNSWLKSEIISNRSYIAHILGHIAKRLNDENSINNLVIAFKAETDNWVKRTLAISCGRAGRKEIYDYYVATLLPYQPHRKINLSYHLEYYGDLEKTIIAIISHICSEKNKFLRSVDLFTFNQILLLEEPIIQNIKNKELIEKIKTILKYYQNIDLEGKIQEIGINRFIQLLSQ